MHVACEFSLIDELLLANYVPPILAQVFFYLTATTVSFKQQAYNVDENNGPVQPVLVLSNPSATAFTVQIKDSSNTATGESTIIYRDIF